MKKLYLLILSTLIYVTGVSQGIPTVIPDGTRPMAAQNMVEKGYTTAEGWTIKQGDKIILGHGSMPNKTFSFVYQSPAGYFSQTSMDNYTNKRYAATSMSGKAAKVKELTVLGGKKTGYTVIAKVGLGEMVNYWIEIENSIDAGELIPPNEYARKNKIDATTSAADELKKWKDLFDSGAITQEEYESQKKKILNLK